MRQLPSTASLLAFEAVARHLSFKRAATELNITQGAVSQRIKALEDLLAQTLFDRQNNAVALTASGTEYLVSVRVILREMMGATDRIVHRDLGNVLTVGCFSTFALNCLIPGIGSFSREHPDIELRLRTPVPFENANIADYDVTIQYGRASRWPNMVVSKLGGEELFPVCSPRLLEGTPGLATPTDLARHTVIRTSSPVLYQDEWPLWLERAGLPALTFAAELNCDFLYPSYKAAIEGLGVAMGRTAVVRNDIAAGRLVEPFSVRVTSTLGYHLIVSPNRIDIPKVRQFRDWCLARFQRDD